MKRVTAPWIRNAQNSTVTYRVNQARRKESVLMNAIRIFNWPRDIGGTKCAIIVGDKDFNIHSKVQF